MKIILGTVLLLTACTTEEKPETVEFSSHYFQMYGPEEIQRMEEIVNQQSQEPEEVCTEDKKECIQDLGETE